jgi:hypothetical protein
VTYDVTLTMTSQAGAVSSKTRSTYVLVACQVPDMSGVHANAAQAFWQSNGFTSTLTIQGSGNYKIGYQSTTGGTVNPPNDCATSMTVGQ